MECQFSTTEHRKLHGNEKTDYWGNAPTCLEIKIIKQYKIFQEHLKKPIAFTPDQLLKTMRTIFLSNNEPYLAESARRGFLPDHLVNFSCCAEWEHLPFDKTPFINEVLFQYTRLRSALRGVEQFALIRLVIKVLKKNRPAEIPTCCKINDIYASLIGRDIVIFKIGAPLGEGCFGVIKKIASSAKGIDAIKIEKENSRSVSSLKTEWKMLNAIHFQGKQRGIQKLPAGLAYIEDGQNISLALFENSYAADLDCFLESYPNLIKDARQVISLFLPIFETLAAKSAILVHCDIKIANILVKIKKTKIKLFLSDWGNGLFLVKEGDLNSILLKNCVDKKIKHWLEKEGEGEEFIPLQGEPGQIVNCTNQILLSRDVLGLGETLYDTLYRLYQAKFNHESDADLMIWGGLLQDLNQEAAEALFCLINEMCNNHYELQEYGGVKLMFPRRPAMEECWQRLAAILQNLDG